MISNHIKIIKSPRIEFFIYIAFFILIIFTAFEFAFPDIVRGEKVMKDYDAFYVTGRMLLDGRLSDAYFFDKLVVAQREFTGTDSFMPWTYPPHFNIVTAVLAVFPVWLGYILFITFSVVLYLIAIRKLAEGLEVFVLLLLFPVIVVCIRTGQNGLLLGAIFGFFSSMFMQGSQKSWLPLVAMTVKPHLMLGVAWMLFLKKKIKLLCISILVTMVILSVVTLIAGFYLWPAFFQSISDSTEFLKEGYYPLFRMFSVYAALRDLGLDYKISFFGQLMVTLLWFFLLNYFLIKNISPQFNISVALFSGLFFSPYAYDYDLPILGVGLALLAPRIVHNIRNSEFFLILIALWLMFLPVAGDGVIPSLGGFVMTPICIFLLHIASRDPLNNEGFERE